MQHRSPLKRVLGLGAAGGAHHWWVQRVTSIALVPLALWFVLSLATLPTLGYDDVTQWLAGGWSSVFMGLTVLVVAWHSQLGVQVIIEDYVHAHAAKTLALLASQFAHVVFAAAGVFAILRIALRSFG